MKQDTKSNTAALRAIEARTAAVVESIERAILASAKAQVDAVVHGGEDSEGAWRAFDAMSYAVLALDQLKALDEVAREAVARVPRDARGDVEDEAAATRKARGLLRRIAAELEVLNEDLTEVERAEPTT